jgi:hypothetical protein
MNPMFQLILYAEGLDDWKIAEGEPYCWHKTKTITIQKQRAKLSTFIHEVAHALNPDPEGPWKNHYHGPKWARTYGRLLNKYMEVKDTKKWEAFLKKEGAGVRAKTPAFILQAIHTRRVPVKTENIGKYYGSVWFFGYNKLVNRFMRLKSDDSPLCEYPAAATELGRRFGVLVEW